ncbi:hypothetical protein [Tsukamurella sputi]|uniref:hypothetical protein n=1 Tax=Tsukamurella sputi TaxID=2591848 RepID=UPI00131538E5|nr:hypothetical protein [Tsukamurella sputi]
MPDNPNTTPAGGPAGGGFSRPPRPTPLPAGGPRHTRSADDTAQLPVQRPKPASAGSGEQRPRLLQQRLQGVFLTIIGITGIVGGVLFSIEAPRFTPVPVVFLTFWLVMVIVGRILFTGLNKLRAAGVTAAPAPHQVRAAAAVAAIVVAVGMMGFAATSAGSGVAQAAPCPGGGPATCGPDPNGPTLTFTPPPAQTNAPGGQQGGQQGGQDNNGIATSPAQGGNNGPGIQAQTPEFGTPGQQAPNIPGNEQPGQGGQQQPAQGQQTGQQNPVQTTAPGQPQQTEQPTQSGQQPSQSTVTVTQTQSQCPAPGAAGAPGAGGPGGGAPGGDGGTTGGPDGDNKDGAPSWAYLVAEATGVMAGRRRNTGGAPTPSADAPTDAASLVDDAADQTPVGEQPTTSTPDAGSADTTDESNGADPAPEQQPSDGNITKDLPEDDSTSVYHAGYDSTGMYIPSPGEAGPFTPAQQAAQQQLPDLSDPFPTPPQAPTQPEVPTDPPPVLTPTPNPLGLVDPTLPALEPGNGLVYGPPSNPNLLARVPGPAPDRSASQTWTPSPDVDGAIVGGGFSGSSKGLGRASEIRTNPGAHVPAAEASASRTIGTAAGRAARVIGPAGNLITVGVGVNNLVNNNAPIPETLGSIGGTLAGASYGASLGAQIGIVGGRSECLRERRSGRP